MTLPAQVRRQTEAVNKLYAELNNAPADNPAETDEVVVAGVEVAAPSDRDVAPVPQPTEPVVETDEEETFEKKFRTLQGKYTAEVPRLHSEKRELTNRVQQLENLIASLSQKPAQEQTPAQKLVTDQDLADYGDSIDVMRRVFREEMSSKDTELDELRQLVRQMQGTVVPQVHQLSQNYAVSNEQRFWADLQAAVPDWQDINTNKEFQEWLLEVDQLTGVARQTYLDDAQRQLDARRVANFFSAWKGMSGVSEARTHREAQATSELERQVAPGKGRSGGTKTQGEARTYSSDDIRKFFADVQRGKYRGKEAERDRIERDIFAAQREGRIVNA